MTKESLYQFIKQHGLAVISTISPENEPQAAVIGIAVTPELEIIFDTVTSSRKYQNLRLYKKVALVIGWDNETTIQYEGIAEELTPEDDVYREAYYAAFPDGRGRAETWPGLIHFKITPMWLRYSNFNDQPNIEEIVL